VHAPHDFFMNWFANQQGEGYEYHLLVIGMALALAVGGDGRWSLDRRWSADCRPTDGRLMAASARRGAAPK